MGILKKADRLLFPCQKHIDVMLEGYGDACRDLARTMGAAKKYLAPARPQGMKR